MKVLLILVDGMRPDAIGDHPLIRRMMSQGSCCMNAKTVMPSVTLPCHMSLFYSVDPGRHGITTNQYVPQVRPVPGLFEQLDQKHIKTAMYYNWENLRDLARPGAIAKTAFFSGAKFGYEEACRDTVHAAVAQLSQGDIDFAFLYLGWVDQDGHDFGWMSEEYLHSVQGSLDMAQEVIDALPDEYIVILTADHGGHDRIHGCDILEDMTIPMFFMGGPFDGGKALENVSIKDIAPTVADLFGAEIPREWEGKIIR